MGDLASRPPQVTWLIICLSCLVPWLSDRSGTGTRLASATFFDDDLSSFQKQRSATSHPMLFFNEDDVTDLRRKAGSTHRHLAAEMREAVAHIRGSKSLTPPVDYSAFASRWNEHFGNNLPPLALAYVLEPDPDLLSFIRLYMDRMASYPKWQTKDLPKDEVPVCHSLVGFATALDFLYPYLDDVTRTKYVAKVIHVTREIYEFSKIRTWGNYYLQNHQATNVVALLIGSIVSEPHHQEAAIWTRRALTLYERTMTLLRYIPDGSLDEGVGYVGYTFRSLSQYVFLLKRHFGVNHSEHPWIRQHFNYYYYTTLPGFQKTVGIADSPPSWFYGPESQLVFLDTHVLQDGSGNWLADQIKAHKVGIMKEHRPDSHRYTTLHTEFLFYNADIKPKPPVNYSDPELHHFQDWGVVTYRSGSIEDPTESFLSFKSSYLHGKFVFRIANKVKDKTLRGWHSFNPGHEHPDQNSFTFWPDGKPLVTDGYYGPKWPYLDNVLQFAPSDKTPCTAPFAGQLGSCGKWLDWHGSQGEGTSHGEVLAAATARTPPPVAGGMVYTVGDAARAYHASLGLRHWYRTAVLLQKDLLLVFDHVILEPKAPRKLTHASAFFQNVINRFVPRTFGDGLSGMSVEYPAGGEGAAFWASVNEQSPLANVSNITYTSAERKLVNSNANVTFQLEGDSSVWGFVFHGERVHVKNYGIALASDDDSRVDVAIETTDRSYRLSLPVTYEDMDASGAWCEVTELTNQIRTVFYRWRATSASLRAVSRPGAATRSADPVIRFAIVAGSLGMFSCALGVFFCGCTARTKRQSRMYVATGFLVAVSLYSLILSLAHDAESL